MSNAAEYVTHANRADDHGAMTITVLRTGTTYTVRAITHYPSGNWRTYAPISAHNRTMALFAMHRIARGAHPEDVAADMAVRMRRIAARVAVAA